MNAAVFVDFENLYLSLKSRCGSTGLRTRELSLQVLHAMLDRLRDGGNPMTIGRSYAAFDTYPGIEVAHDLALMGLDPQYVLISSTGKNSADVQIAVDVARVVFRRPDIQLLVIVSGDRDFIPLARQVLEEGRELRVVAIPDATSGDLRERVGAERFWNAMDWIEGNAEPTLAEAPAVAPASSELAGTDPAEPSPVAAAAAAPSPVVVGRVPVTWPLHKSVSPEQHEEQLQQCLELLIRAQIRHNSPEVWLSPFLKGAMTQYFGNLVHPERRALINELRSRGAIRVEERENAYADHPYSVIVVEENHPMAIAARARIGRGGIARSAAARD